MEKRIGKIDVDWSDHRQGVQIESYDNEVITIHFYQVSPYQTSAVIVGESDALEHWYLNVYGGHPDDLDEILVLY